MIIIKVQETIDKLTAIRDLKVIRLNDWLESRIADLKLSSGDYEIRGLENIFNKETRSAQDIEKINAARELFQRKLGNHGDYKEVFFIDSSTGLVEISTRSESVGLNKQHNPYYVIPMETGDVHIKDVYRSHTTNHNEMTFSIPVFCMSHNKHIIGVIVARIDLENSLYPLLSNRVGLGETGETLIVNKDVVAINELRWHENAPLNLKIHAEPAVNAAQGKTGIIETPDYREEPVLAAYAHIPSTGWGFVCKQDMHELNAPIRTLITNFIYIFIFFAVIITFIAFMISKTFTLPIKAMGAVAKKIQKGDFSSRNKITSKDEIGSLATAFNNLAETTETRLNIQEGTSDNLRDNDQAINHAGIRICSAQAIDEDRRCQYEYFLHFE